MKNLFRSIFGIFDNNLSPEEAEIQLAIKSLKAYSDTELSDLGIARCEIEHSVRFGLATNTSSFKQNFAV